MTNLEHIKEFIVNSYVSKINKFCKKDVLNEINNADNIKEETVDFLETLCKRFDYLEESLRNKDQFINLLFIIIGLLILITFLTGCDNPCAHTNDFKCQEKIKYLETNSIYQYKIVCIDGKEYIEGASRLANNLDSNGKPISCEVK